MEIMLLETMVSTKGLQMASQMESLLLVSDLVLQSAIGRDPMKQRDSPWERERETLMELVMGQMKERLLE